MSKRKPKRLIRDLRRPQLFSNEDLGLPPDELEIRGTKIVVNKYGQKVRIAIVSKTKDSYVAQAREVWGDRYDYSESEYIDERSPITIYCPKHDYHFTVSMAQNHIKKRGGKTPPTGCPYCTEEEIGFQPGRTKYQTQEQKERNERKAKEKAKREQRREERKKRAALNIDKKSHSKTDPKREAENKAMIEKWHAKTLPEARFRERVFQTYGDDLDTSIANYVNSETPVDLICRYHGLFTITPRILLNGQRGNPPHGCWKCSGLPDPSEKQKLTAKTFYRRMATFYKYIGLKFQRKRKINLQTRIKATCYKHGEIEHDAQWWLDGKGCEYCNGKIYYPDFLKLARAAQGDGYQYRSYENISSVSDCVEVHCPNPDHEWHPMLVSLILHGCKCRECAGRHQPVEQRCQKWIEKSDKKYRGTFDYSEAPADYINNDSKVWLTHKPCGTRFQITPDTHLRGVNGGCPLCNAIYLESEGERAVRLWLEDHGIDHRTQEVVPNEDPTLPLKYLKVDFWLDDVHRFPMVIEYNGPQHYEYSAHFHEGHRRDFVVQVHRDRYLRKYCSDRHIQLLEIPYTYFDQIGDILEQTMNGEMPDLVKPKIVMPSSDKT